MTNDLISRKALLDAMRKEFEYDYMYYPEEYRAMVEQMPATKTERKVYIIEWLDGEYSGIGPVFSTREAAEKHLLDNGAQKELCGQTEWWKVPESEYPESEYSYRIQEAEVKQ